jgi:hypothetical protein
MPFRIRMRAGGETEIEVDTVAELLQVPVRFAQDVAGPRLLTDGSPAVPAVEAAALVAPRPGRRVPRVGRAAAKRVARPVSAGSLTDDAVLAILKRGPAAPGDLAKQLRAPRHRVTERLNGLAARGLAHATGATFSRRWHHGPSAAPVTPARRSV